MEPTLTTANPEDIGPSCLLDYPYIISQVIEARNHLEEVINKARNRNLNESELRLKLHDVMRHLNRSYNLRCSDKKNADHESASQLPREVLDLFNH